MNKQLTEQNYRDAAFDLGVEVAALKAVAEVESAGDGFLPDGYPKILFEGHLFSKYTLGAFDKLEPTISYAKWTKEHYKGGAKEYERLHIAITLNRDSALRATSWGKFQILGANFKDAGYDRVSMFVHDMHISEREHLKAFVNVIRAWQLVEALKHLKWEIFARKYNGPGFKQNQYDEKMAAAYIKYKSEIRTAT